MRKTILSLGIVLSLVGTAIGEGSDSVHEVAVSSAYRAVTASPSLVCPSSLNLQSDLQEAGLVGTFSQRPLELQPTTPSPRLVNDSFVVRPRPQRLEELSLPDRSRPHIMKPNNRLDLIKIDL